MASSPTRRRTRASTLLALSLATLLPASALPANEAEAAPTTSAPLPGIDHKMPTIDMTPKPYRVRMKLTMVTAGDASEGPGNTEDEIYFSLAGIRKKGNSEIVLNRRTVRPGISRDFFEMGKHSASQLEGIVFEGEMSPLESASFALLIQEQDNKQAAALAGLFFAAGGAILEAMAAWGSGGTEEYGDLQMGQLKTHVNTLLDQMKSEGDELMGAVRIRVKGGKLDVKAPSAAKAQLLDANSTAAKVKLTGGGGHYELRIYLESMSTPRPLTQTYLSREDDDCGEEKLWVEKKGGGNKLVYKGDGGVQVRVKDDVFHWHCGDMDTDDVTNAPNDTKMVEVTRSSSGDTILWDCYHEKTAVPQYEW
jgi:hypothetical protein